MLVSELGRNCRFKLPDAIERNCGGLGTTHSVGLPLRIDADEIRRLGKRFRKLDLDKSGALSVDEFMSLPELQQNPLVQRVIDIFDTDGNGEVDFKEFIEGVSQFSVKGDKESKLKCKFRWVQCIKKVNPLHPNISIQILHTFFYKFPMLLARRICLEDCS
ncbi:hypothetical protein pdam_00017683 [Pocillopora damicornis]|uniref:EF-hand domain-containing protein n=1 Tax=Pocillopora damicornis TaxID=46731 RepID=A0A3M6TBP6_POCDA|nr:hypothetical protein pdam_00017683 [Pocillopora damicornis]